VLSDAEKWEKHFCDHVAQEAIEMEEGNE